LDVDKRLVELSGGGGNLERLFVRVNFDLFRAATARRAGCGFSIMCSASGSSYCKPSKRSPTSAAHI
jgi:hypothetical protein